MSVKQFSVVNGADNAQVQKNVKATLDTVTNKPILDGNLIITKLITAAGTSVAHGLGRKARGYIIVSSTAQATFSDDIQTTTSTTHVTLTSNTGTVVNLWIF